MSEITLICVTEPVSLVCASSGVQGPQGIQGEPCSDTSTWVADETELLAVIDGITDGCAQITIAQEIAIAADLTIPDTVNLKFLRCGMLSPESGVTLTVNSTIDAGLWQIFGGDGTTTTGRAVPWVYVEWFGAVGDGITDDAAAIQAAVNASAHVKFSDTDYATTTKITSATEGMTIELSHYTGILYDTPDYIALEITGDHTLVTGGLGRGLIGPEAWDGTNNSEIPRYAVIRATECTDITVSKTRLYNVRRSGIRMADSVNCHIDGCIIEGNYPSTSWTGVETVHSGIALDPSIDPSGGNYKITNNTIKSCVQGVSPANIGAGQIIRGLIITGNLFEGCWNHGIYTNFTNGAVITGNNFNRCQKGVVISGDNNTVTGNSFYTAENTNTDARDIAGIEIRDGSYNTVQGNTIRGAFLDPYSLCISVGTPNDLYDCIGNVITGNVMNIVSGTGIAIRVTSTTKKIDRTTISNNTITIVQPATISATVQGAIAIVQPQAVDSYGNIVTGNNITIRGECRYGIFLDNCASSVVSGNTVIYDFDAAAPLTVSTVLLATCVRCAVLDNMSILYANMGANVTVFGCNENTSGGLNTYRNSLYHKQTGNTGTYEPLYLRLNTTAHVEQTWDGAPTNIYAGKGSIWHNHNATGDALYVKNSTSADAVWTGVALP